MPTRRTLLWLALSALLLTAPGCRWLGGQRVEPLPRMLPSAPSLDQVIDAVNRNSSQITSFSARQATLSGDGFPSLRAEVVFERPRRLRLRADTSLTGPEVDLGSNDEMFWFWVRRNQPAATYFARHDQFQSSPARQTFPLDPEWFVDALGVMQFDPGLPHQGPYPRGQQRVEVRTIRETPQGPQTRVVLVDSVYGVIWQQAIYDAQGRLTASADALGHRRDPLSGLVLPTTIVVKSIPAQVSLRLDLGVVEINRPIPNAAAYWNMPRHEGYPLVDLCNPQVNPNGQVGSAHAAR